MRPSETARDWARHVAAALAASLVLGAVLLAAVVIVLNAGTVAGIGATVVLAALAIGTTTWWIDRRARS